jgi:hypothetical protein
LTTLTLFGFDLPTERNGDVNAHDKQHRTPLELIAETNHTFATDFKGPLRGTDPFSLLLFDFILTHGVAEHHELSKIKFGQALNDPAFSDVVITNGDARYYCHQVSEPSPTIIAQNPLATIFFLPQPTSPWQAILCARCPAFEQAIEDSSRSVDITLAGGHGKWSRATQLG